jgi:class 3 adenylate cyclase
MGAVPDAERAAELLDTAVGLGTGPAGPASRAVKTFMFTDIVKSTNLVDAIGDEAWEDILHWHDQTLRSLFAEQRGEEVKHVGDGFFVAFPDAAAAIECAVAIQCTLAGHRREQGFSPQVRIGQQGFSPQVRIGLHTTEATRRGRDYGGKGVHKSARIAALADADEILASQKTLTDAPVSFSVSEPREVSLKGISKPVSVVTIDWR